MKKNFWLAMVAVLCLMAAGCGSDVDYFTISGQVYSVGLETDIGWPDVNVTLDGDRTGTTVTDADGNYRFVVPAGDYRITPTLKGNSFDPPDNVFTVSEADINGVDFMVEPLMGTVHADNTWKKTGSMTYTRWNHTMTLLDDGRVLVAGGYTNGYGDESAEIYDPATGVWSTTGAMKHARISHTATLLDDGKVLVAGGSSRRSAELYDPETGTWSTTGSMTYGRSSHTATLLDDGKVLVAGGKDGEPTRSSAEIYDPETGTWSTTGSMTYERHVHTATLLSDGKVLVAGGQNDRTNGSGRASAELYDPKTRTWSHTGAMTNRRYNHTATLLADGTVLVAGGALGAWGFAIKPYAEIYNPETGRWSTTGSMNYARDYHTAILLANRKVLVAGGLAEAGGNIRASAELYDPETGTWSHTGAMTSVRDKHAVTLLDDGRVLVTGGETTDHYYDGTSSAEIFKPDTNQTTAGILYYHTMTLLDDGKVLVAGGIGESASIRADAELYDWRTGDWSTTGPMNHESYAHTMTLLADGAVLVTGGKDESSFVRADAERYDPEMGTWSHTGAMTLC